MGRHASWREDAPEMGRGFTVSSITLGWGPGGLRCPGPGGEDGNRDPVLTPRRGGSGQSPWSVRSWPWRKGSGSSSDPHASSVALYGDPGPVLSSVRGHTEQLPGMKQGAEVESLPPLGTNGHFLGAQAGLGYPDIISGSVSPRSSKLGCTSLAGISELGRAGHICWRCPSCGGGVGGGGCSPLALPALPGLRWDSAGVRGAGWLRPACPGSGLTPLPGPLSLPGFLRLDGSEVTGGFLFSAARDGPNWKDMSG